VTYDTAADSRLADGLRGTFNRLARVNDMVNVMTAFLLSHPERRLMQDTFCTANRISRYPETFVAEIKNMKKNLTRLPKVISELSTTHWEAWYNEALQKNIDQGKVAVNILKQISI